MPTSNVSIALNVTAFPFGFADGPQALIRFEGRHCDSLFKGKFNLLYGVFNF